MQPVVSRAVAVSSGSSSTPYLGRILKIFDFNRHLKFDILRTTHAARFRLRRIPVECRHRHGDGNCAVIDIVVRYLVLRFTSIDVREERREQHRCRKKGLVGKVA